MYCDNRAKFSMVTTRIACAKCISLMSVTSHDVGSFQSCSVSNIYAQTERGLNSELYSYNSWFKGNLLCLLAVEDVSPIASAIIRYNYAVIIIISTIKLGIIENQHCLATV